MKHKPILDMPEVSLQPYEDFELSPALEDKIEKLMKFFDASGISYDKFDPASLPSIDFKKGYPNDNQFQNVPGQRDLNKWINTVKSIHYLENNGTDRVKAIRKATSGWNSVETFDFLNWIRYYEGKNHLKYKFAQLWYENENPGYFLHMKKDNEPKDVNFAPPTIEAPVPNEVAENERKDIIEEQRNKIISRLDSAEKLLRTREGQLFAGNELEALLQIIYQLKTKIHLLNKVSTSYKTYDNMIIREANILNHKKFFKAANLLLSLSQANNPPPAGTGTTDSAVTLNPTPTTFPTQMTGNVGGLPSKGPGSPDVPPDSVNDNSPSDISPVEKFIDNLETSNFSTSDDMDDLTVQDNNPAEDLNVEDSDFNFIIEAQEAQESPTPQPDTNLEVAEEDIAPSGPTPTAAADFDSRVNEAFSNVTVSDVVAKLEDLAKIFKTREIPRQLNVIDMMLDSIGLAPYFPGLSEAISKSFESNNYISSRIDDVLSKLRGSIVTNVVNLKGNNSPENPELIGIKNKLRDDEDKEKARKQMRRDQEYKDLSNTKEAPEKETPEVNMEKDLQPPQPPVPQVPSLPTP